jgi:hypothetical protein
MQSLIKTNHTFLFKIWMINFNFDFIMLKLVTFKILIL